MRSTTLLLPPPRRHHAAHVRPGAALFPAAGRSHLPPWTLAIGYVSGFAAVSGAALLRQPGLPATKTIWAEDGRIFYAQATALSFWRTLTTLHNGYMQLFPRLAVQLARLVPAASTSTLLALIGAVSLGALSCLVFHMARGHIASPGLRVLLAAGMVLLPVANVELLDNLVNVPWWLFFATFWALIWRPRSRPGQVVAALLCFVAAASEPLVGLFLPLAVARWAALREPAEQAAGAGLVLGLLYQAVVILPSSASALSSPGGLHDIGQSFAVRVGLGIVGGVKGTDWLAVHGRQLSIALGFAAIGGVLLLGLWARSSRVRLFTVVAVAYSAVCFVVPVWLRAVATALQAGTVRIAGRYQAIPVLLIMSAVLVLADYFAREGGAVRYSRWRVTPSRAPSSRVPSRVTVAVAICTALFLPSWVADFRGPNQRSSGPAWASEVAKAGAECRRTGNTTATLSIDPAHWTAILPCRVVAPAP
ncbi:MAG TPA: hypothetical protein VMF65_03625 [Acidimicrobiales bacterium]|nr:hypothetical protein [Acidimicrobiales bacterium]